MQSRYERWLTSYNVVSISGLHMVLAAGVVFWLVRALLALIPHKFLRRGPSALADGGMWGRYRKIP